MSSLHRRRPASPLGAARLRRELSEWVRDMGVPSHTADDIVQSTYEAMANTVLHAYPPDTLGTLELLAEEAPGTITVTVTDRGTWREPEPGRAGGRGLTLIRALCHRIALVRGPHGTTVRMSWARPSTA